MTISRFYSKHLLAGAASFCALLLLAAIALAAADHSSAVSATLCKDGATLTLRGSTASWRADSAGTNTSVLITARLIHQNNSVTYINVASGVYTTTALNTLNFLYTGLPTTAISATVYVEAAGTWGDGTVRKSINDAEATYTGDCALDKLTPTPEPPTPTLPIGTSTTTPTSTPQPSPTPIIVPDADVSISALCKDNVPTFVITAHADTPLSRWDLYVDGTYTRSGRYQLLAGDSLPLGFVSYSGVLKIFSAGKSATMTTENCSTQPTDSTENAEPVSLRYIGLYRSAEGNMYAQYEVVCDGTRNLAVEFVFADDALHYQSDTIGCEGTIYVPSGTQMIIVSDTDTERVLLEKEPPIEISDPPSTVWLGNIYLPIVVK